MIRVVMFDLGDTLVDEQGHPFPHVAAALQAIMAMQAADGTPLASCLVSDYTLAAPPPTPAKVKALFDDYLVQLEATGLRSHFEPVTRRVTLSTHAGVRKPDRRVFEAALQRLKTSAELRECLVITEHAGHVAAARALGLQALQFGDAGSAGNDFDDWSQAPALVAHRLAPGDLGNLELAARVHLAAHDVELESLDAAETGQAWRVRGQRWHAVHVPGHDELGTLHVALPVQASLQQAADGALRADLPAPDAAAVDEACAFVASLAAQGQIATGDGGRRTTHAIETDAAGRRCLVRKRFSAL